MNTNQIRKLLASLQLVMRCPGCGKKYNLDEIFLRGSMGNTYFLQLDCANCHTPVYATIALTGNLKEVAKNFEQLQMKPQKIDQSTGKKLDKISSDEIIDTHKFLKDFKGDFESEFSK